MASFNVSPFHRNHQLKEYLDRLNREPDDALEELRRECWRTITKRLSELPALRMNTFISSVLSVLIDGASKECLVAILLAIDISSDMLAKEGDNIR